MRKTTLIGILAVAALCAFAMSCTTSPYRNRGSLSDAMDKARDDHEGSRRVPDRARPPDYDSPPYRGAGDGDYDGDNDVDSGSAGGGSGVSDVRYGIRGSTAILSYGDCGPDWSADFVVSASGEGALSGAVFVGLRSVEPKAGSDLDLSVDGNLYFLRAGVEATYLPIPEMRVFCPYLTGGLGGFLMLWEYENTIIAGSERIDSDTLGGVLLFCGVGVYPYRGERLRLSVGLTPEVYFFGSVTNEGFDNDYFSPMTSVSVRFELLL